MTWISATAGGDSTGRDTTSISGRTGGLCLPVRKNGDIKSTRPLERIGAHTRGFNKESIGICYEGGLDCKGHPKDTRTEWQKHSMRVLILTLLKDYPGCRICGHRDLSPDLNGNGEIEPEEWIKACPCFNAEKDWGKV